MPPRDSLPSGARRDLPGHSAGYPQAPRVAATALWPSQARTPPGTPTAPPNPSRSRSSHRDGTRHPHSRRNVNTHRRWSSATRLERCSAPDQRTRRPLPPAMERRPRLGQSEGLVRSRFGATSRRLDAPTVTRGAQPARPQIRHRVGAVAIDLDERATFDALRRPVIRAAVTPADAVAADVHRRCAWFGGDLHPGDLASEPTSRLWAKAAEAGLSHGLRPQWNIASAGQRGHVGQPKRHSNPPIR